MRNTVLFIFFMMLYVDFGYCTKFTQLTQLTTLSEQALKSLISVINKKPIHSFVVDGRASQDIVLTEDKLSKEGVDLKFNAVFDGNGGGGSLLKRKSDGKEFFHSEVNVLGNLLSGKSGESSISENLAKHVDTFKSGDEESIVSAAKTICINANENVTSEGMMSWYSDRYTSKRKRDPKEIENQNKSYGSTFTGIVEVGGANKIILMNVGDSPAYVIDRNGGVFISALHNTSNEGELDRMRSQRVVIDGRRFGGFLALSRIFGMGWPGSKAGSAWKPIPEVYSIDRENVAAVFLMSDGPCDNWDVDLGHHESLSKMPESERQKKFIESFIEKLTPEALSDQEGFEKFLKDNQRKSRSGQYDDCAVIIKNFSTS